MTKLLKLIKDKKGQGLLEYAFLIAGIAFISLVALSVFGHKVADQYAIAAGMLPGGHDEDNLPIATTEWLETTDNGSGAIVGTGVISWQSITGVTGSAQINNVGALGVSPESFVAD
ncbi:MAG TPA: hypothetical protein VNQ76_04185 [Planctomicrobium sp.]|nr:hypothetical protein [Planctomicrobium sp.]